MILPKSVIPNGFSPFPFVTVLRGLLPHSGVRRVAARSRVGHDESFSPFPGFFFEFFLSVPTRSLYCDVGEDISALGRVQVMFVCTLGAQKSSIKKHAAWDYRIEIQ